ncbi:SDR family NAD(P)-dependent oxidoreductase [Gluconacetobacter sp. Hr-1-5]|uniref:SDR family NAD(P)-dependent oxidoreductase n=1 Tax=Gluconacetobacter sp. Hr-1-5 TaxID=3395370 RepID=UPI003B52990D
MILPPDARRLEGRVAIITGGASGIGRAICRLFAAHGAHVLVADVTETVIEGGEPTVAIINAEGGHAVFQHCDISDSTQVDALVARAATDYGALDIIVNNACLRHPRPLVELAEADWKRILDVNLTGAFLCCQAAVRQMLAQPPRGEVRGRIVNLSSQHGMISAPGDLAYGTTKAAIAYMTRQIASDYAKDGIVCNAIAPGKIVTGQGGHLLDEEVLDRARRRTPWPRFGHPDDVARGALYLASDDASFVTGVNLMVDGGWMAA